MEKALTKVSSLNLGSSWISKKAKEELSNISQDIAVSSNFLVLCVIFCLIIALCMVVLVIVCGRRCNVA